MDKFKKSSSIQFKIFLLVLLNVVILISLFFTVSNLIISKSYLDIENIEMVQNVQRASDAIENNISELNTKLTDWAFWDDTYNFVQNRNKTYVESNLSVSSISNLRLNLIAFFNLNGDLVYKKMIDSSGIEEVNSDSIGSVIVLNKKLTTHESTDSYTSGIVIFPEGPMLVSSKPVLTSQASGPIKGTIIFGTFLDDNAISALSKLTHLSMTIYDLNSLSLPTDVLNAKLEISKAGNNKYFTAPLSSNNIAGYKIINDIYGNGVLILKVDMMRDVFNQSQKTFYLFISIAIILIILFGIMLFLFIKRFIISRLLLISTEVENVNKTGDLSLNIQEGAKDEIGILARIINHTFKDLVSAKKIEHEAVEKTQKAELELESHVRDVEKINQLMVNRELKMIELKEEINQLKNKLEGKG